MGPYHVRVTVYPSDGAYYIKIWTNATTDVAGPFDDKQDAELAAIRIAYYMRG